MHSLVQIADELGLSKSTVSRALRGMPGVSEVPSVDRWFAATALSGVTRALAACGYDAVLFDLQRTTGLRRTFHRRLLRRRVDGLVVLGTEFTHSEYAQLAELAVPLFAIGGIVAEMPRIGIDDFEVAQVATRHLLEFGHERIGMVGGIDPDGLNRDVPRRRRQGWAEELASARLSVRPDWIVEGGFTLPLAKAAVAEFLARAGPDRPTAFFCMSDEMAMGAMLAIREAGLTVPGDISVIGIDGHPFAEAFGLTTCEQDPAAQGRQAADGVMAALRGSSEPATGSVAPFELKARSSTAAWPG